MGSDEGGRRDPRGTTPNIAPGCYEGRCLLGGSKIKTTRQKAERDLAEGAKLSAPEAKERLVKYITDGLTIEDACRAVNKSVKTYEYYRASDPQFRDAIDLARVIQKRKGVIADEDKNISFEEFRLKYLNSQTFDHQRNVISVLENGEPAWLHHNMIYEPGFKNYVLVNMPPEHAKSMTVSIDYVVYRICTDPNVRIKLVSKTQQMAKEFLYAVKQRLTSPQWAELQRRYAPVEGFKSTAEKWTQDAIYLERDSGEKDPTLQALGIGGQIYGARADLIILDDCVTLANANEYEKQIRWIQQEVLTRVGPTGKILIVGTRVDPLDMYRELRNPDRYPDEKSPWTYLAMPAVLEFADEAEDWITLWPKSDRPWNADESAPDENGLYPRWDGNNLRRRRGVLDPKTWAMVYQQQDVESTAIFNAECVRGSVSGMRAIGPLLPGVVGHPAQLNDQYVVCAMDPAMSGDTFSVVLAGDRTTQKRYLLEASRMPAPSPDQIRDLIFSWTEKYKPRVWVIEKNAFQLFLTQDPEVNRFLASRGIKLVQHYTGNNKMDAEFGVASLAPLFGMQNKDGKFIKDSNLLELPRTDNEHIKALIEQLITWSAGTKGKQDGPMALWFAETEMRNYLNQANSLVKGFIKNPYATRGQIARRQVVNLEEYQKLTQQLEQSNGVMYGNRY